MRDSTNIPFTWVFENVTTDVEADHDRVQAMVPGPGSVIEENDQIQITVLAVRSSGVPSEPFALSLFLLDAIWVDVISRRHDRCGARDTPSR